MRGRSGHDKARAVVVAYLRVSGPVGPLTSVYSELTASPLTATNPLVTTSIIKSDTTPGLRPGAAALFSGGQVGTGAIEASAFSGGERRGFCCFLVCDAMSRTARVWFSGDLLG